ncbi:MAG: ABC transporter ATP-binding protein [Deltaproteobacteria bacterium RBG_13_51_10]|nr:MAG: ABC transporter ATP-binding protein [Deltaproteobacteria bacterium RBG_13_51_10]
MLLEVNEINTFYGKSHILHGISLEAEKGEIVTLLGRNGVGKSTTLKSIIGLAPPQRGSIRFQGEELVGLRPYKICRRGIGYVPEDRRIFPQLTVRQNLLIGLRNGQPGEKSWTIERIYSRFPALAERDIQKGGFLSGGEQQMLTIGRTLMGNPKLLLTDEPTEGLAPLLVEMVISILTEVKKEGGSILLVSQAMDVALELAEKIYVMSKGKIVFRGTEKDFSADEGIRKKYLEV